MEFKFNVGDNVVYKKDTVDAKLATIFKKGIMAHRQVT